MKHIEETMDTSLSPYYAWCEQYDNPVAIEPPICTPNQIP